MVQKVRIEGKGIAQFSDDFSKPEIDAVLARDYGVRPDNTEGPGALRRGFIGGLIKQNPELISDALDGLNRLTGGDPTNANVNFLERWSQSLADLADEAPDRYDTQFSLEKVLEEPSVSNALSLAGELFGAGVASAIPSIATGAIGAVAGSAVAGPVGTVAGGLVGAAVPSAALNYGEVYRGLLDEGVEPDRAAEIGAIAAVPITGLDLIAPGRLLSSLTKEARQGIFKRVAKAARQGATDEGITEALQEAIKEATVSVETGKDFFTSETALKVVESGIAGVLTGAGIRGAFAVPGPVRTPQTRRTTPALQFSDAVSEEIPLPEGFYSALEQSIATAQPNEKKTVQQWAGTALNRGGVKPEEISDLIDSPGFPLSKDEVLTRDQMLDVLRGERTEVEIETRRDDGESIDELVVAYLSPEVADIYFNARETANVLRQQQHELETRINNDRKFLRGEGYDYLKRRVTQTAIEENLPKDKANSLANVAVYTQTPPDVYETDVSRNIVKDLENIKDIINDYDIYSELYDAITTNRDYNQVQRDLYQTEATIGELQVLIPARTPEYGRWDEITLEGDGDSLPYGETLINLPNHNDEFTSPHFEDARNNVAHGRYTLRDGGETFFVEEIQSDIHEQARKVKKNLEEKGAPNTNPYAKPNESNGLQRRIEELSRDRSQLVKRITQYIESVSDIVDGTFIAQTFLKVSVTRQRSPLTQEVFRDEFFVKIANENLDPEIKSEVSIVMRKLQREAPELLELWVENHNILVEFFRKKEFIDRKLADFPFKRTWPELVFKEMLRQAVENGSKRLALPTGRTAAAIEGTSAVTKFYNDVLPKTINKYLKKQKLPPLQRSKIKTLSGVEYSVWELPITDEVKAVVQGKQPLFSELANPGQRVERTAEDIPKIYDNIKALLKELTGMDLPLAVGTPEELNRFLRETMNVAVDPERRFGGFFTYDEDTGNSVVGIALQGYPELEVSTVYHEAFHVAQRFLLTDKQRNILDNNYEKIRKMALEYYPQSPDSQREFEAYAAEAIRNNALLKRRLPNEYTTILETVRAVLERLVEFFRGNGFQNMDDVYAAFLKADIAKQPLRLDKNHAESGGVWTSTKPGPFAEWFGNSVVRWPDGAPRPVFHASKADFNTFKLTHDIGFHFATTPAGANTRLNLQKNTDQDPQDADLQYDLYKRAPVIYPVFIKAEKPLRLKDLGLWHPMAIIRAMAESGAISEEQRQKIVNDFYMEERTREHGFKTVKKLIKDAGYDSVVYENQTEGIGEDSYIVFDSNQIKSVFNQSPTSDPRIQYSMNTGSRAMKNLQKAGDIFKSPRSISWWHDLTSSPRHIASKFPKFAKVFNIGHAKHNYRMNVVADSITDVGTGTERFGALQDAKKHEVENITDMFIRADELQEHPTEQDGVLTLEDQTLTENESRIYKAVRDGFRYIIDQWDQSYRLRNKEFFDKYNLPVGTSRETLNDLYKNIVEMFEADPNNDQLAALEKELKAVTDWLNSLHNLRTRPYFPHIRFGDKGVAVYDEDGEVIHLETIETKGLVNRFGWTSRLESLHERLKSEYPGQRTAVIDLTNDAKRQELLNGNIMTQLEFLSQAMSRNDSGLYRKVRQGINEDFEELSEYKVYETLRPTIEQQVQKRGFAAHLTKRKGVPGYDRDLRRVIGSYVLGASNMSASLRYGDALNRAVGSMDGDRSLLKYASDYAQYIGSPVEEFGWLRQLGFMYYLGGNASSAMLQLVTLPEFTVPALAQISGTGEATKEFTRAYKDVWRIFAKSGIELGKGNKPADRTLIFNPEIFSEIFPNEPELTTDLKRAFAEGDVRPILTLQQMGMDPARAQSFLLHRTKLNQAYNMLPAMFNMAEVAGRMTAYIAAHRLYQKPGVAEKMDAVFANNAVWQDSPRNAHELGRFMIDETFGMYGKGNRPRFMRGPGSAIFQFSAYPLQMLELMARTATRQGKEGKMAFGLMMLALFAFGGWQGWPLAENIKDAIEFAWKGVTGRDYDAEQAIRDFTNEITGTKWVGEVTNRGFVRMLGMDISRRATLGEIPALDIVGSLVGERASADQLGVPMSLTVGNIKNFHQAYTNSGELSRGVLTILPPFIRNMIQAVTWNNEGVMTGRGDLVLPKEEIGDLETFYKTLGFNPAKVAQAREKRFTITRAQAAVRGLTSRYYRRLTRSIIKLRDANRSGRADDAEQHRKTIRNIFDEIRRYNQGVELHERVFIDNAALKASIRKALGSQLEGAGRKTVPRTLEIDKTR